jgi:uncharacterized protein (DUF2236 family)
MRSVSEHRQFLETLAARVPNPQAGFFGPESMAWRINREMVLGLVVLRALFMQIAHPKVAQGVADHSDFANKPFARAYATFKAQQRIVFGTCEESIEALMRIYARHVGVIGEVREPIPSMESASYRGNDPELLFWVYATLFDSMLYAYRNFLPQLPAGDLERFYEEGKLFAKLIGIPEEIVPRRLADFDAWMHDAMASDTIFVSNSGLEIGHSLLRIPFGFLKPFTRLVAGATLPPRLKDEFGLDWSAGRERLYIFLCRWLRFMLRRTPAILHSSPAYWTALRRVRAAEAG